MGKKLLEWNLYQDLTLPFAEYDASLVALNKLKYQRFLPYFATPPQEPGLYIITGGGQTGKTTLLKLWIDILMKNGVGIEKIFLIPGRSISNYHELRSVLSQLTNKPKNELFYLMIDDVSSIRDWEKSLRAIFEQEDISNVVLILTSADNRVAKANIALTKKAHYQITALTFHEFIELKYKDKAVPLTTLFSEFDQYLIHGGHLPAINDMATYGSILTETFKNYSEWLKDEMRKQGKQSHFLQEILQCIVTNYNNAVTWNQLAQQLTINHPKTIADYLITLEKINVVFMQYALLEKTLSAAPKKARKVMFMDPFIFHAIRFWLKPEKDFFTVQILPMIKNSELVKSCVTTQYAHFYPTFYLKGEGEIDLTYINENRFWPVVISWTNELRPKVLKEILKYQNGKILTKIGRSGMIEHIRTEPLPQALWKLQSERR